MTSKTARVNAALRGTLSPEEQELQASGMEMSRITHFTNLAPRFVTMVQLLAAIFSGSPSPSM
jgi:hypothetical protein